MKITELKSNEGGLHYYNKGYLMDWIVNKDVVFQNQEGYKFYINTDRMEFGSMESYIYKESGVMEPYHSGQCGECIRFKEKKFNYNKKLKGNRMVKIKGCYDEQIANIYSKLISVRFSDMPNGEWNKNILIMDEDYTYFKSHPCNFCKYKGVADCIFIFDIAFSHKGKIEVAVEVNNTSPVKWNKLKFCRENEITLIQVCAKEVNLATQRINKIVSCEVLNIGKYSVLNFI